MEWTTPEQRLFSSVRRHVVTYRGRLDDLILKAHRAKRISAKLRLAYDLPPGRAVPRSPRCVIALAIRVMLALRGGALRSRRESRGARRHQIATLTELLSFAAIGKFR